MTDSHYHRGIMEIDNFLLQDTLEDLQFFGEDGKKRYMTSEKCDFTNVR